MDNFDSLAGLFYAPVQKSLPNRPDEQNRNHITDVFQFRDPSLEHWLLGILVDYLLVIVRLQPWNRTQWCCLALWCQTVSDIPKYPSCGPNGTLRLHKKVRVEKIERRVKFKAKLYPIDVDIGTRFKVLLSLSFISVGIPFAVDASMHSAETRYEDWAPWHVNSLF